MESFKSRFLGRKIIEINEKEEPEPGVEIVVEGDRRIFFGRVTTVVLDIDSITNIGQLNTYLRNTEYRLSSEEWIKLAHIAAKLDPKDHGVRNMKNKLAWLHDKTE